MIFLFCYLRTPFRLKNLNVADCGLRHISMPNPVGFSSLSSLNITKNPIEGVSFKKFELTNELMFFFFFLVT